MRAAGCRRRSQSSGSRSVASAAVVMSGPSAELPESTRGTGGCPPGCSRRTSRRCRPSGRQCGRDHAIKILGERRRRGRRSDLQRNVHAGRAVVARDHERNLQPSLRKWYLRARDRKTSLKRSRSRKCFRNSRCNSRVWRLRCCPWSSGDSLGES